VEGGSGLPADVRVALYRITQEALNNVSKHSRATEATVKLLCQPGSAELHVCDNGCGFDLHVISPEHFGLDIMRERSEAIGAILNINTDVGHGTEVAIIWLRNEREVNGKAKPDTSDNR
jgi:nitrate/nitrite-specific signal transduction histidine kinase